MPRYSLKTGDCWIAAVYADGRPPAVHLTPKRRDAGSWASHEQAMQQATLANSILNQPVWVYEQAAGPHCTVIETRERVGV